MDNSLIKHIVIALVLFSGCSYSQLILAQEQQVPLPGNYNSPPPANNNAVPLTQAEAEHFQNWLKSHRGHKKQELAAETTPPAAVATTVVPPIPSPPAPLLNTPRPPLNNSPQIGPEVLQHTQEHKLKHHYHHVSRKPVEGKAPLSYREEQRAILREIPAPGIEPLPESKEAFKSLMQQNMPLTPEQVVRLRQLIDATQRAAATPANIPPKPVSTTLMINLAPGSTPPAIRLAQGYVTSLVFVDSTGAPWPIAAYVIGNPKSANIQWDGKSNIILIQAVSPYGDSDLVIRLVGLMTPITLALVSGQRVVDYRTDIHVSGIGPNTKELPTGTGLPQNANQLLLSILDGVAPPGSKQLAVNGCRDCQAWLLGDKMYFRTRFTVLSPGWVGRMVSPDGMNAYEIQKSSSILISQYGQPIELRVEGF